MYKINSIVWTTTNGSPHEISTWVGAAVRSFVFTYLVIGIRNWSRVAYRQALEALTESPVHFQFLCPKLPIVLVLDPRQWRQWSLSRTHQCSTRRRARWARAKPFALPVVRGRLAMRRRQSGRPAHAKVQAIRDNYERSGDQPARHCAEGRYNFNFWYIRVRDTSTRDVTVAKSCKHILLVLVLYSLI